MTGAGGTTPKIDELILVVGSVRPFDVEICDEDNADLDLSAVIRATLRVAESVGAAANILSMDTTVGDLAVGTGKVTGTPTQAQADALTTGMHVAEVALEFPAGWQHTDLFHVRVRAAVAEHLS